MLTSHACFECVCCFGICNLEEIVEVMQGQGMRNAEMLVWAGDFNYRIDATYEDAIDRIRCNDLEYLLERVCKLFLLLCVRPPRSQHKSQLWLRCLACISIRSTFSR